MKLYLRLFWENHVTKLVLLLLVGALYFKLSSLEILPSFMCCHNQKANAKFVELFSKVARTLFMATLFGFSPVIRYRSLVNGHHAGKHILERSRGSYFFPCYRSAYRLALKDLNIKPGDTVPATVTVYWPFFSQPKKQS